MRAKPSIWLISILLFSITLNGCGTSNALLSLISSSTTYITNNNDDDDNGSSTRLSLSDYLRIYAATWLDASNVTLVSGNEVAVWNSGSDSNISAELSAIASAQRPTYIGNAINGLPAINFTSRNCLEFTNPIPVSDNYGYTVIFVTALPLDMFSGWNQLLEMENGQDLGKSSNGGLNRPIGIWTDNWNGVQGYTLPGTAQPLIITYKVVTENTYIYVNKALAGSVTPNAAIYSSFIRLGNNSALDHAWGSLSELLIFDYALADAKREEIEEYLNIKYSIGI